MRRLSFLVLVIAFFAAGAYCGHALRRNSGPNPPHTTAVASPEAASRGEVSIAPPNTQKGAGSRGVRDIASERNASTRSRLIAETADNLEAKQTRVRAADGGE